MTFSLRRKRRIIRLAKSTRSRTACSALALLAFAGFAFGESPIGESRSTFAPRGEGPRAELAAPVVPAQGKVDPIPPKKDPAAPVPGIPAAVPRQDPYEAYIRLEPPGRERLFGNRDTERELEERMRQERRDVSTGDPIVFPERADLGGGDFVPRKFEPMVCLIEPSYVVYRRLYFEEKNAERYGWELGAIQPAVSTYYFFRDVALFPYNFGADLCRRFETSAGQCPPGNPVPYYIYPPELSGSGLLAEVATIALLVAVIP